ncbi:uncharacterized protein LOC131847541 [Achroia grisella]|uniref:uncharacterized protein LOC131847541 n=1 Tax=Achroia grisella TaxID=688607 RepID=UPI0027D2EE16|nr:uncharacterized protein LOC131847541 [Achroia grisella]
MSVRNKLLEEIHPLDIIREVQKWPALYTKDGTERANLHFKNKIWYEIGKSLFPPWESFPEHEKLSKVTDLMKRWRNLRDTFKRQLDTERKTKGGRIVKRKRYVYFKHMSFLLPHLGSGDSSGVQEGQQQPAAAPPKRSPPRVLLQRNTSKPANTCLEDIDEDKHFLLSLVPSFKRMSDDEKLTAKVEILNVIKTMRTKCTRRSDDVSHRKSPDELTDDLSAYMDGVEDIKVETAAANNPLNSTSYMTYESENESASTVDSD